MPEEKAVSCAFCGKVCENKAALRVHIEVCKDHPMSALRACYDKLMDKIRALEKELEECKREKHS